MSCGVPDSFISNVSAAGLGGAVDEEQLAVRVAATSACRPSRPRAPSAGLAARGRQQARVLAASGPRPWPRRRRPGRVVALDEIGGHMVSLAGALIWAHRPRMRLRRGRLRRLRKAWSRLGPVALRPRAVEDVAEPHRCTNSCLPATTSTRCRSASARRRSPRARPPRSGRPPPAPEGRCWRDPPHRARNSIHSRRRRDRCSGRAAGPPAGPARRPPPRPPRPPRRSAPGDPLELRARAPAQVGIGRQPPTRRPAIARRRGAHLEGEQSRACLGDRGRQDAVTSASPEWWRSPAASRRRRPRPRPCRTPPGRCSARPGPRTPRAAARARRGRGGPVR